jgi:ribosome-binding protein aMBF1 (putative translation factor)
MEAARLIREARRRAGLTQSELAERSRTKQSVVARWESGATGPSYDRVAALIRECGFDLVPNLAMADDSDWSLALDNLRLSVDERVRKHAAAVRFAQAGRTAKRRARG